MREREKCKLKIYYVHGERWNFHDKFFGRSRWHRWRDVQMSLDIISQMIASLKSSTANYVQQLTMCIKKIYPLNLHAPHWINMYREVVKCSSHAILCNLHLLANVQMIDRRFFSDSRKKNQKQQAQNVRYYAKK